MSKQTLSETSSKAASANGAADPAAASQSRLARLHAWAGVHWTRRAMIGAIITLLVAGTVGIWTYLARLTLRADQVALETVLAAYDDGDYERARALVNKMLDSRHLERREIGGPLYVLGALKARDAEAQQMLEQRRTDYLIASRYLKEARGFGLPPDREAHGLLLLGKSLLESNQFAEGIEVLDELLREKLEPGSALAWQVHGVLGETCLFMPSPNLQKALTHFDALLNSTDVPPQVQADALLLQAKALARLGRFDDARQALESVPASHVDSSRLAIAQVELTLDEAEHAAETASGSSAGAPSNSQAIPAVANAVQLLESIEGPDRGGATARRVDYLMGRALALQGNRRAALERFTHTRQLYGDTLEGLAAALAEANLLRALGDFTAARDACHRILESVPNPSSYRSEIMPLAKMREEVLEAFGDFIEQQRFEDAISLLDHFTPLFTRTQQLELRGITLERWGDLQLSQVGEKEPSSLRADGLRHLREAGVAFEQLAELRFGTEAYTNDLWNSAENYFRGHNYSNTIRVLNEYLEDELELRNAAALLRLGQAYLALGKAPQSIAAFEECIEFHPLDPATYQARIDCAKACWSQGETDKAEQLLRNNIAGSTLKPNSREWKDSLFVLGSLLHEKGQFAEAINVLEEAIERYPRDSQCLLARYVIGESYRRWAEQFIEREHQARNDNERDKNDKLANERLSEALRSFEEVQRSITFRAHDFHDDPLLGAMLRNCYMFEATVLFDLGRYDDAIKAYSNVSALYPNEPFVLETFVQIANCWHRLNRTDKARGAIQQAQIALDRMPSEADFTSSTAFSREEWRLLLNDMSRW